MVSAFSLCVLIVTLSVVSSQAPTSTDPESELVMVEQTPVSDRRTLKSVKSVKYLPLLKKHKKFGLLLPHKFGKAQYAEVPIIHEAPIRPIWKVHRYQGIEVKPLSLIESAPTPDSEPIIETDSYLPSSHEYAPDFSYGPSFSNLPPSSNIVIYPIRQKPIFSSIPLPPPSTPIFNSISALPPSAPIFQSIPAPPQPAPIFQSIPVPPPTLVFPPPPASLPSPPIFSSSLPSRPTFSFVPAPPSPAPELSIDTNKLPPPSPIFSSIAIAGPAPTPAFTSIPARLPSPPLPLPSIPAPPAAAPVIPSFPVKLPPPVLPPISLQPSAPALPPIALVPPPPTPILPPAPLPLPPAFSSLPPLPLPVPTFSTPSIPAPPEPEYPYPPSGTPIPSYIKDISLGDIPLDPTPTKAEPTIAENDNTKDLEHHAFETTKTDNGIFQKFKTWKAEKANAALNHLSHFKPFVHHSASLPHPPVADKIPLEIPSPSLQNSNAPFYPTLQFPGPLHPLPLTPDFKPAPVFLPSGPQFLQPIKYESFPPNKLQSGPLFNSYGVPIPHDSYSSIHGSHDRVAPASEEEPSILPAPSTFNEQTNQQDLKENQFQQTEIRQQQPSEVQFQQDFQQSQPQALLSQEQPIYVPEGHQTQKEDSRTIEEAQPTGNANQDNSYQSQQDQSPEEDPNLHHHRSRKE